MEAQAAAQQLAAQQAAQAARHPAQEKVERGLPKSMKSVKSKKSVKSVIFLPEIIAFSSKSNHFGSKSKENLRKTNEIH